MVMRMSMDTGVHKVSPNAACHVPLRRDYKNITCGYYLMSALYDAGQIWLVLL